MTDEEVQRQRYLQEEAAIMLPLSRERLKVCNTCNSYNKVVKVCSECYCFMPIKSMFKDVKCPLGKWKDDEQNESSSHEGS